MLRSVCDFRRFTIAATDGSLGRVGDLYFAPLPRRRHSTLVVGKKVLVSPEWLTRVTWDESKTLFSLVTAVHDGIASATTAMPSIER
jgi:hypothetical protein